MISPEVRPVFVSRPAVFLPEHVVTRETILADMLTRHPDHPRARLLPRLLDKLPATRRMSRPWETVISDRTLEERNRGAFADVVTMGGAAARQVLELHGVDPGAVDCVVTTHSTGDAVPGLDVHLVDALGLRPDVSRRPMTQLGCGGGAHGLVMAAEFVRARPGSTVLVVAAESLSSIYHHGDTDIQGMIFKALWGDSGAAVLVSDRPFGPGLQVDGPTWEYLIPGSAGRYTKRLDADGVHFDSVKASMNCVPDMGPALREWLWQYGPERLDFVVAHTGGEAILASLADELEPLGVDTGMLVHSWASLDEEGNLGGPSVLAVLDRTHAAPPKPGDRGLLLGFGPGFSVSALTVTWTDG
jgi:predicted naringenin-chalcone synthase